jgi:hypothetical protein
VDLTVEPTRRQRVTIDAWRNAVVPLVFLKGHNHSDILRKPSNELVGMVTEALAVASGTDYSAWMRKHGAASQAALTGAKARRWQQMIVHATDERGDGISDYFLEAGTMEGYIPKGLPPREREKWAPSSSSTRRSAPRTCSSSIPTRPRWWSCG